MPQDVNAEILQERLPVSKALLRDLGMDANQICADHGIANLRRYPVLSEGGWALVIVNQETLEVIHRASWHLLGPVKLLSQQLDPR